LEAQEYLKVVGNEAQSKIFFTPGGIVW
jgi:hypothetical protein